MLYEAKTVRCPIGDTWLVAERARLVEVQVAKVLWVLVRVFRQFPGSIVIY